MTRGVLITLTPAYSVPYQGLVTRRLLHSDIWVSRATIGFHEFGRLVNVLLPLPTPSPSDFMMDDEGTLDGSTRFDGVF